MSNTFFLSIPNIYHEQLYFTTLLTGLRHNLFDINFTFYDIVSYVKGGSMQLIEHIRKRQIFV